MKSSETPAIPVDYQQFKNEMDERFDNFKQKISNSDEFSSNDCQKILNSDEYCSKIRKIHE
jgi:hypothetical protein